MTSREIWLVDDEPAIHLTFGLALTESGYRVKTWEDGGVMLAQLRSGAPDLFVLDVNMPQVDGWKILHELRHRGLKQPVLMLTRLDDVDHRVRGLDAGADDYLGKPC